MYFDEDLILDIRLNTLNKFVSKFVICEAKFNHNGINKKLNFREENFKKFRDKIEYIVLEDQPKNLKLIEENDTESEKNSKILDNALIRENFQRNYSFKNIKKFSEEDLVIINDLDEIPNLENFTYKNKITIFKQKMFYYKLNLEYPNYTWMGSRICKLKHLKKPQWLKNIKPKSYPIWRADIFFSNFKYHDLNFVSQGGWHFTNVKSPEDIDHKMKNFLHHLEYEKSGLTSEDLKKMINDKKVMYDHLADKTNVNKWKSSTSLKKVNVSILPKYISDNLSKFKEWID